MDARGQSGANRVGSRDIVVKKKSLAENFIYNILYQLLVTALPIITTPYTARVLGLHANGSHAYTESIVTYFIILGYMGTALYGTRKIAYVRENQKELVQTAWSILWLRLALMAATLAVYVPVLCVRGEFAYLYRIQIINIVANGIDLSWFYQGVEDFKKITLRNLLVKALYIVCLFTLVRGPADLWLYVFLIVASALLGNILMWFFLKDYLGPRSIRIPRDMTAHLRGSLGLFLPQVTNYIYSLLDRSMLKWMTGNTDYVSVYDQGQRLIRAIIGIMQSVGYAMMARLSNLQATHEETQIRVYIRKSLNLTVFFALPIMFGLCAIAKDFVPLFLGDEYGQVVTVLQVLSPLVLVISVNSVMGVQLLISVGKEKPYTVATSMGALVNTLVNLALLPSLHVLGACISSLAAEAVVALILCRACREYISFRRLIQDNWLCFAASAAILAIVWLIQQLPIGIPIRLAMEVGIAASFYFGIMLLTKNEVMGMILQKLLGRFRKGRVN